MVKALAGIVDGTLLEVPQPENGATYAEKIGRADERLDWRKSAAALERAVRALYPAPGVWFEREGERIKVLEASVRECSGPPGTVIDDMPSVSCGTGALALLRLQRPGRKPLDGAAFLRGYPLPPGTRLG